MKHHCVLNIFSVFFFRAPYSYRYTLPLYALLAYFQYVMSRFLKILDSTT